jgi:phosphatidylglycerol:prolipoprotein diacylglycerol transferase
MLPLLFPGTAFETPTYFVLYLMAFLGAILLATRLAPRWGLSPVRAIDFGFWAFVFGFLGARLVHILVEAPSYYWNDPIRVFYFWQGGFVLYGGLIAAALGLWFIARWLKEPYLLWGDRLAPAIFLGIGIGRMGCLSAGCCHGGTTTAAWGIIFTHPQSGAPLHMALHPTQALESLFGFVMCGVFLWAYRRPPQRQGEALVMTALVYSVFRFTIEFLRGDFDRGVYSSVGLSTSQMISLGLGVISMIWLFLWRKPTSPS